jgi:Uncharacterised protein family (UPF0236)
LPETVGGTGRARGKKTAEAIQEEVAAEIARLLEVAFGSLRKERRVDMEALEMATRAAMHRAGATVLEELLDAGKDAEREVTCRCGQHAHFHEMRPKQILTALGCIQIQRPYYVCNHCHQGQSPRDRELDVEGTEYSPALRRMIALVGSEGSFEQGRQQLDQLAGLQVTTKAVERQAEAIGQDIADREQANIERAVQLDLPEIAAQHIFVMYVEMDGTGVPVVKAEIEGRQGKTEGQPAHTREVKLGCVFTQTRTDEQGRPVRDEASTSYTGAIETAEQFGRRLYREAWDRGCSGARKKVVLGDGALWIWNIADEHFPGAIQIVDLYHARQHLWELASKLFPADESQRKRWASRLEKKLDAGKIETLIKNLRAFSTPIAAMAELLEGEAAFFERNAERMRYAQFRAQKLFVGSGVVEAGCKTVIGRRLKMSGMFWTVRGANAIIALRCNRLSGNFEDYWESRHAA